LKDKITILIVDDHPLFREGLKSLIHRHDGFEVVDEAETAREAIEKAKDLIPDMVIMDISLPDQSGIEATREIRSSLANTRVMILSMHSKIDYIAEAFRSGATGYIVKESASERLVECLEAVSRGEYFIDTSLSHKVVESLIKFGEGDIKISDSEYANLTPREQQVMRLIAEGFATKEIAERLFISPKTVENHRANIMNKLGLHTTLDLVKYAAKLGLIDVELWKN
jgi:DNA-binding NarL/FixJ family response regulator